MLFLLSHNVVKALVNYQKHILKHLAKARPAAANHANISSISTSFSEELRSSLSAFWVEFYTLHSSCGTCFFFVCSACTSQGSLKAFSIYKCYQGVCWGVRLLHISEMRHFYSQTSAKKLQPKPRWKCPGGEHSSCIFVSLWSQLCLRAQRLFVKIEGSFWEIRLGISKMGNS